MAGEAQSGSQQPQTTPPDTKITDTTTKPKIDSIDKIGSPDVYVKLARDRVKGFTAIVFESQP